MCWERRFGGRCRLLTAILIIFPGLLVILVTETILNKSPIAQYHLKTNQTKFQKIMTKTNTLPSRHPLVPSYPYPYPYKFIINQKDKCSYRNPFLVLLVISRSDDAATRNIIRNAWGNESNYGAFDVVTVFLVGLSPLRIHKVQLMLEEESVTFRDIIQQNFLDTYNNLTIKTLMGMEWVATFCTSTSYVMKVDSDVLLNVEYLVYKILRPDLPVRNNYFVGRVRINTGPYRNKKSKWYVSEEIYPNDTYPPYCGGSGYAFSVDMAKKIYTIAQVIRLIPMEDVSMGICLKELHISPIQHKRRVFHRFDRYNLCAFKELVAIHVNRKEYLRAAWKDFWSKRFVRCGRVA